MSVPHDPQTSNPTPSAAPPSSIRRSMDGFRHWWAQRGFRLAPDEARTETPAALRDAAVQFSSRVWEIAANQARGQLEVERATVNERVAEANAKVQQATLARGRAENHGAQLEKRLAAADKTRQDMEKQLSAAATRQNDLQTQLKALEQARTELQKRLDEAGAKSAEQQKQLASLRAEIAEHDSKAEKFEEDQQRQLEKAKQHYAALESQLATLLEIHKSARQGFEKGARSRD
jgi:chromosome segregation ATPase